jgi:hypothetical protein
VGYEQDGVMTGLARGDKEAGRTTPRRTSERHPTAESPDPGRSSDTLSTTRILGLQRAVGNHGTTQMILLGQGIAPHQTVQRDPTMQRPDVVASDAVPGLGDMGQTAMTWIEQVWGALNQGLADFEHNSQVTDWAAFAGSVLGNLIWAAAAFSTGGGAFLISIGGIGVATAATVPSSKDDFFVAARAEHDQLNVGLKGRVPQVTKKVHDKAVAQGWSGQKTYQVLMGLLLRPDFALTVGGIPTVNSPRIAALVEQQLHLRAGSTPTKDWKGWGHGNWWVEYEYRVDGAQQPIGRPAPFAEWRLSRERADAQLLPVDTDVRNARDRLNAVAGTLGGMQRPAEWPLRKQITVYFRGSRAITVHLDGGNRVIGTGSWYMSKDEVEQIAQAAGWKDLGSDILGWVCADAGGKPPPIKQLR